MYYVEDLLGTSRVLTTNAGVVCYDADFYPYGGERSYTNTCPQNYKFEGKERDTETGNDDFGARYYSNRFGRWLSADWSAVPVPVPYANLSNPQTLNLYAMVSDDPESFADLDGHADYTSAGTPCNVAIGSTACQQQQQNQNQGAQAANQQAAQPPQNHHRLRRHHNRQNRDVAVAERYLSRSRTMRQVLNAFKSGHFHIVIIHDGDDRYDPSTRTVYWDPHSELPHFFAHGIIRHPKPLIDPLFAKFKVHLPYNREPASCDGSLRRDDAGMEDAAFVLARQESTFLASWW